MLICMVYTIIPLCLCFRYFFFSGSFIVFGRKNEPISKPLYTQLKEKVYWKDLWHLILVTGLQLRVLQASWEVWAGCPD